MPSPDNAAGGEQHRRATGTTTHPPAVPRPRPARRPRMPPETCIAAAPLPRTNPSSEETPWKRLPERRGRVRRQEPAIEDDEEVEDREPREAQGDEEHDQ
jgi:hypothetical protein